MVFIWINESMCTTIDLHYNLILCWIESQTDLEEEKGQEIAKLQDALHAMQIQVEEANIRAIQEREAAQKAIEEAPPVIKETPVLIQDTEKIDSLTSEVESLKVCSGLSYEFFEYLVYIFKKKNWNNAFLN